MGAERQVSEFRPSSRTLSTAALANAVLWVLSVVALIVVMQRSASPKGLFVIMGGGLATALSLLSALRRLGRGKSS